MGSAFRVVRLGDDYLRDTDLFRQLGAYLRESTAPGEVTVLVHGGNMEVFERYKQIYGRGEGDSSFSLISDRNMPLMTMVLAGELNKRLVALLGMEGVPALGVCGADAGLMESSFLNYQHLGRIGGPPRVNAEAFRNLAQTGCVLVMAPVCPAPDGDMLLLDADTTAQTIAVALKVDSLLFATRQPALQINQERCHRVTRNDVERWIEEHFAGTELVPKIQAALAALNGDVSEVVFGNVKSFAEGNGTFITSA